MLSQSYCCSRILTLCGLTLNNMFHSHSSWIMTEGILAQAKAWFSELYGFLFGIIFLTDDICVCVHAFGGQRLTLLVVPKEVTWFHGAGPFTGMEGNAHHLCSTCWPMSLRHPPVPASVSLRLQANGTASACRVDSGAHAQVLVCEYSVGRTRLMTMTF